MTELRLGMLRQVAFNLGPVAVVVADAFARRADGQQAAERLDIRKRILEIVLDLPAPRKFFLKGCGAFMNSFQVS